MLPNYQNNFVNSLKLLSGGFFPYEGSNSSNENNTGEEDANNVD